MKILQLSDIHGVDSNQKVGNLDPVSRLSRAVEHINQHHSDAAFCAVTGDIADTGSAAAYKAVKQALDKLKMPYHPIVGNHDLRRPFLDVFSNTPLENGYIQYRLDHGRYVFLFLDTLKESQDYGELCDRRLDWIKRQIQDIEPSRQVLIFMHHPPFSVALPWMDSIMLKDGPAFYNLIKDRTIRYIFFGHIHRPSFGTWQSIPYAASRSVGHYQICPHNEHGYDFPMSEESPMYSVIRLSDDQVHIDLMDFTNDKTVYQT